MQVIYSPVDLVFVRYNQRSILGRGNTPDEKDRAYNHLKTVFKQYIDNV